MAMAFIWHGKRLGSQLCCPCFSKLILIFFLFKARRLLYIHLMSQNLFYFFGDFPTFSFFFQEKSILILMHFTYILLFLKLPIVNTIHTRGFHYIIYTYKKKQLFWFLHSFFYNYIYACTFIKDLFVRRKKATLYIVWDLCIRLSNGYYPNNISVLGTFIGNLG